MRVSVLSLVPDAGHLISSLRVAEAFRSAENASVDVIAPNEARPLLQRLPDGYSTVLFGEVMPPRYRSILNDWAASHGDWERAVSDTRLERQYFVPTSYNGWKSVHHVRAILEARPADILVADDLLFSGAYASIALDLNLPLLLHRACGSLFPARRGNALPREVAPTPKQQAFRLLARLLMRCRSKLGAILAREDELLYRRQLSDLRMCWGSVDMSRSATEKSVARVCAGFGAIELATFPEHYSLEDSVVHFGPLPSFEWKFDRCAALEWIRSSDQPVLLISLGSMAASHRIPVASIVDFARTRGFRCLLLSSEGGEASQATGGPDFFHAFWADQSKLLGEPQVQLFVTHAGSGALQDALWSAVPVLCIPTGWDQPYNAWLAEKLGVGVWMKGDSLSRALDASFSLRTKMQQRMSELRMLAADLCGRSALVEFAKERFGLAGRATWGVDSETSDGE